MILMGICIPSVPAITIGKYVDPGAMVYIGEEGLNISETVGDSQYIGWWASAANIYTTAPDKKIAISSRKDSFTVSPSDFATGIGNWYKLDTSDKPISTAFNVVDPYLDIVLWNQDADIAINDGSVASGTHIKFRLDTNMYTLNSGRHTIYGEPTTEGFITIRVVSSNGASYTKLSGSDISLEDIFPSSPSHFWNGVWDTGDTNSDGIYSYNNGKYTIHAECNLNHMKDNYRNNGADYTGKTITASHTITIGSAGVSISSNTDSITRGKPFTISITGKPSTNYYIWVTKTSDIDGTIETAPQIQLYQDGVSIGEGGNHVSSSGRLISADVPSNVTSPSKYYAIVKTDSSGKRTVSFTTSVLTKSQDYTIRLEDEASDNYDETQLSVSKGGMTIVAKGNQIYYLGEVVKFSGVNTESSYTYLYFYGPNLPYEGSRIDSTDPRNSPVINNDASTFKKISTNGDGSWSWDWSTSTISIDAGTYIVYAVSQPLSKSHLLDTAYSTTSISFRKPTLSATTSQATIAKGDKLIIRGFAEGDPHSVAIWIMGKNYAERDTTSVDTRSEFNYEIGRGETIDMASGQYLVIVQHPMQNGQFDIVLHNDGSVANLQLGNNGTTGTTIFQYTSSGSLQGTDAATALIHAIEDPNVDDMYTKLMFTIMEPIMIIDEIGTKYIGEKITITGKTNLAVNSNLMVDITSSTFKPTNKSEPNEFAGASISTSVYAGDDGYNRFAITVDTSTFVPDEYIVTASAIESDVSDSVTFIVLNGQQPLNSTITITQSPSITVQTTIPTPIPTTSPIPTTTSNKLPGFGAIYAISGLIIVGAIIAFRKD